MKFNDILEKCYNGGDEHVYNGYTTYSFEEGEYKHILKIFTKNYGKNRLNDVIYIRETCGTVVYEWKGTVGDLKFNL